jgi:hypothetical protein
MRWQKFVSIDIRPTAPRRRIIVWSVKAQERGPLSTLTKSAIVANIIEITPIAKIATPGHTKKFGMMPWAARAPTPQPEMPIVVLMTEALKQLRVVSK